MKIIGISCFYHDAAIAAVEDGEIRFAIHEERLSRHKHDSRFPIMGIGKALEFCKWNINEVDEIVFYESPELKKERIIDQIISDWPETWETFKDHFPRFFKHKYDVSSIISSKLRYNGKISVSEHHRSHAASAFYVSPFEEAIILTIDGVGECETTAVYYGKGNTLTKLQSIHFPDSLGLLYSVFTQYLGFEVNEGEYKVMGLAPYGKPIFVDNILDKMICLQGDGSYYLNQKYFKFSNRERHYTDAFIECVGIPPRLSKDPVTQEHKDLAASVQKVLEVAIHSMLRALLNQHPTKNVCFAGGVALNCTANSQMIRDFGINLFIQPAAGDAGGALGAALDVAMKPLADKPTYRFPFSPYLGQEFSVTAIEAALKINKLTYERHDDVAKIIAEKLANRQIVAIYNGRDEWGPRALGNRSILADTRTADMKEHLNAKIKFREEFRPFAPIVMQEHYGDYFETLGMESSPYMLFTHMALQPEKIPAVVHADKTSRVQSVSSAQNHYLYAILEEYYKITGVPVLINTSFNLRGEPIVSSPSDAIKTFYASDIDYLCLGNFMISKTR